MKFYYKFFFLKYILLLFIAVSSCTNEFEANDYKLIVRNSEIKARIVPDSTLIYRSNRNNGQLNVPITYKAVLLDQDIDSLEWIFPGGSPNSVKESLSTEIVYSNYGSFNSKLILTRIDTVNLNNIISYKDTIEITRPVKIVYKETNWDTFTTNDDVNWTVIPNSKSVIIRENEVFEQNLPFVASAKFTGFNNKKIKFSVEYKLSYKNYHENSVTSNTKLEVLIDDLKAFGVTRVTNEVYFAQDFFIDNLDDFNFIIKKYPALSSSNWEILFLNSNVESNVEFFELVNQNQLIGYLDLSNSNTSSETLELLLQNTLNGNEFRFGKTGYGQTLSLDGLPIPISPGFKYKLIVTLDEGLPISYRFLKENFTSLPVQLENNEYFLDASFRRLQLSID